MNKLHRSRYINVVVSMMMAFLMLAAMGTTQVHAAQYTTGTIDPAELKAGDVVYRGVQLTVDRQIVVCKKCNMIWITTGTDYGTGDMKRSEVVATEAHKDHPDKVGYSEFIEGLDELGELNQGHLTESFEQLIVGVLSHNGFLSFLATCGITPDAIAWQT